MGIGALLYTLLQVTMIAGLNPEHERDALQWIEAVSEFDADATR